ncbi:hypothetical protein, partial [Nocardia macrotermitis]|uniref:hypothetical protein n=1 Tax=Nocardia macrotermitis TaxID=2585198 RepID=UPI001D108663
CGEFSQQPRKIDTPVGKSEARGRRGDHGLGPPLRTTLIVGGLAVILILVITAWRLAGRSRR